MGVVERGDSCEMDGWMDGWMDELGEEFVPESRVVEWWLS